MGGTGCGRGSPDPHRASQVSQPLLSEEPQRTDPAKLALDSGSGGRDASSAPRVGREAPERPIDSWPRRSFQNQSSPYLGSASGASQGLTHGDSHPPPKGSLPDTPWHQLPPNPHRDSAGSSPEGEMPWA